jgi:hypothetical protein
MKEIHEGELLGYITPSLQLWHCPLCDTYWSQTTTHVRRQQLIRREDPAVST